MCFRIQFRLEIWQSFSVENMSITVWKNIEFGNLFSFGVWQSFRSQNEFPSNLKNYQLHLSKVKNNDP